MNLQESKQIINGSKNIYLIASAEPEAIASVLALFYTLRGLNKNVNLILDDIPENLKFLAPSLEDFISYPKSFVISIPDNVAKISQIYYEKKQDNLKIYLTLESGIIKKDNISFYFSEQKPDLVIAVGIRDYMKELSEKLDPFGFLLDCLILNIDNSKDNKNFGKINLIKEGGLSEIVFGLIDIDGLTKKSATCLLTGLVIHSENFQKNVTAETFQIASNLIKIGADLKEINNHLKH